MATGTLSGAGGQGSGLEIGNPEADLAFFDIPQGASALVPVRRRPALKLTQCPSRAFPF